MSEKNKSWKQSAADRNANRNAKDLIKEKPLHSKKNKKKWCKGKEGKEHQGICMFYVEAKCLSIDWMVDYYKHHRLLVCKICGKELDWWVGRYKTKPDWVDK